MFNYTAHLDLMFDAFQDAINGRGMTYYWKRMGAGLTRIQFNRDDYNLDKWTLEVQYYAMEFEIKLDSSMSYRVFEEAFKKAHNLKIKQTQNLLNELQNFEVIG